MRLRLHQFLKNLTRKNWQSSCDGNRTLDFRYDSIKNKKFKIEENHQKNLKDIRQNVNEKRFAVFWKWHCISKDKKTTAANRGKTL